MHGPLTGFANSPSTSPARTWPWATDPRTGPGLRGLSFPPCSCHWFVCVYGVGWGAGIPLLQFNGEPMVLSPSVTLSMAQQASVPSGARLARLQSQTTDGWWLRQETFPL